MTDISGIWVVGHRVYVIKQVGDKFVWKLMTEHGEQTGIGEFTEPEAMKVIWDCSGGETGITGHATGRIKKENGSEILVWSNGDVFKRPYLSTLPPPVNHVPPPPINNIWSGYRELIRDWLNQNSNGWANGLVGPNVTRNNFCIFQSRDRRFGTCYSVWTEWTITIQQANHKLVTEIGFYPAQSTPGITGNRILHQEGYEVRIFFRSNSTLSAEQLKNIGGQGVCANLIQQYGFKDNTWFVGGQFDYVKVFHNPVIVADIIRDITPYMGQLHGNGGGQHLEPYIRDIINAL